MKLSKTMFRFFVFALVAVLVSCSGGQKPKSETEALTEKSASQSVEINHEAKLLLDYLAETGDYVNSREFPSMIGAEAAEKALAGKTLVIDMRRPEVFAKGHIKGAVNVEIGF